MPYTNGQDRDRSASAAYEQLIEWADLKNVAEKLDQEELDEIGQTCVREYEIDLDSRSDWEEMARKAQERADMEAEEKNYPFENAANIKYPLLITATLQFAARAYAAVVPGNRLVRGKVVGDDSGVPQMGEDGQPVMDPQTGQPVWQVQPGAKKGRAERVSEHMSHQLLDEQSDWEEDTDTMLHQLPILGCGFRKVWEDKHEGRRRAEMVIALDLVVNNDTRSLDTTPRITQRFDLYPHEFEERVATETYLDVDIGLAPEAGEDEDAQHEFIEQHRLLDLDGDGYREPWVVTVHLETSQVVCIVPNYDPDDLELYERRSGKMRLRPIARATQFIKYSFIRDHKGGFYDLGWGQLLESLTEVINTTLNQIADAAHLQNAGGGFIGSGLRLKKQHQRVEPGKYAYVQASGAKIREAIYNHEHPGPSPVSLQLLELMLGVVEKMASLQDVLTGDVQTNIQPTTLLALIEQGQKQYTAIYKRIYRALTKEFQLLFKLNSRYLEQQEYFNVMDSRKAISRDDYNAEDFGVVPVSDPKMVSDMQRLARGQLIFDVIRDGVTGPRSNVIEGMRRYYDAAGVEDAEDLIVEQPPVDPMQEQAAELQVRGAEAQIGETESKTAKNEADAAATLKEADISAQEADNAALAKMEELAIKRRDQAQAAANGQNA